MSTDIKLGKTQFFQFSNWAVKRKASSKYYFRILSNSIGNLCKQELLDLAVPLSKVVFPRFAAKRTSAILGTFEKKI